MINKIFKHRYFLISVQFITLFIFVLLIYGAIGITTSDPSFAKVLRNTNLANLIVWSYWWPFIIITAILFGRFWCTICPMELITSLAGKLGLKRKPGKALKSGWISTLFYAIILVIGIHTLAIHRIPNLMAIYMLTLFTVAVIVGLVWEKRTFCTYVCPIGHLLGLYSLISSKELRVADINVCNNCKTKNCISNDNHYNFIGRSCTSELYPAKLTDNKECILCGQCHKSCSHDNIVIKSRKFASDLFSKIELTWAEIVFFILVSGFVIYEILSEWEISEAIIMAIPNWVNQSLDISSTYTETVKAVTLFIILPAIFYSAFAMIKKSATKKSWRTSFSQLVIAILPITASMHLVKALLKTTSRIPYWNYALSDTEGITTAQAIIDKNIVLNKDILFVISPILSIVAVLLPIGGFVLSILIIKRQQSDNTISQMASVFATLIYTSLFLITIIAWRFL